MDQSDATMNELNGEFSLQEATIQRKTSIPCSDVDGALTYDQSLSNGGRKSSVYERDGSYLILIRMKMEATLLRMVMYMI